jgi:hypothetical protein
VGKLGGRTIFCTTLVVFAFASTEELATKIAKNIEGNHSKLLFVQPKEE